MNSIARRLSALVFSLVLSASAGAQGLEFGYSGSLFDVYYGKNSLYVDVNDGTIFSGMSAGNTQVLDAVVVLVPHTPFRIDSISITMSGVTENVAEPGNYYGYGFIYLQQSMQLSVGTVHDNDFIAMQSVIASAAVYGSKQFEATTYEPDGTGWGYIGTPIGGYVNFDGAAMAGVNQIILPGQAIMLQVSNDFMNYGGGQIWGGTTFQVNGAPVPEPAAWMSLMAGLTLLGYIARRRKFSA
jgi:hypothetical protein